MSQGKAIGVFTLMNTQIAIQKIKISFNSKTCDMSDIHGSNALNDARNNLKSISMIA